MTFSNTPQAGPTAVPSARAERQRVRNSDAIGIASYSVIVAIICVLVVAIVLIA